MYYPSSLGKRSNAEIPFSAKRRRSAGPSTSASPAVRKYVNRRIAAAAEEKYIPFEVNANNASYDSPTLAQLNQIPTGATDESRVGDEIKYKELSIKGNVQAQGNNNTIARFIVFQWYSNTTPGLDDVLVTPSSSLANYVNAPYVRDNLHRMKVLYDKRFAIAAANSTSGLKLTELFSVFIRSDQWGRRKVNYIANSTTQSTNTLYTILLSNVTDASGVEPVVSYSGYLSWTE